ncbi:hypothetical protein [Phytoactinopolyspora endophytica]|nr:hypothetical protein [Phytoactinopolyspora endophytica]
MPVRERIDRLGRTGRNYLRTTLAEHDEHRLSGSVAERRDG